MNLLLKFNRGTGIQLGWYNKLTRNTHNKISDKYNRKSQIRIYL